MTKELTKEDLKKIIFDAFKDVPKGNGCGVRECAAEDDYASEEDKEKAREQDIEQHWWEYPKELIESNNLDYALSYNNKDGIKFHLPALMTADIDRFGNITEVSIFSTLCLDNFEKKPHHGYREYVGFMKSIDISKIIKYYNFTREQTHAIALYFLFDVSINKSHQFFDNREDMISLTKRIHEQCEKYSGKENYNLTPEDAIAIVDEEHRIMRDWFKIGDVDVDNYVFVDNAGQ